VQSDLPNSDNIDDFLLILRSRPGTPSGVDGPPGWKRLAAVLAAKTAFRRAQKRALERTHLEACHKAAGGVPANGAASNEQPDLNPLDMPLDDVRFPPGCAFQKLASRVRRG
jgi:hypothetical protein